MYCIITLQSLRQKFSVNKNIVQKHENGVLILIVSSLPAIEISNKPFSYLIESRKFQFIICGLTV